jgi:hypothetical protein
VTGAPRNFWKLNTPSWNTLNFLRGSYASLQQQFGDLSLKWRGRRVAAVFFLFLFISFLFDFFFITFSFSIFLVSFLFLVSFSCFFFIYISFLISFFLFHFSLSFYSSFLYSISFIFLILLFLFIYFYFLLYFFYFYFYIVSFLIVFTPLIFLLFEMRCKFVIARIISCSGYENLVRAVIITCSNPYSDLF